MSLRPIAFDDMQVRCHHLWEKQWLLLTAGDYAKHRFNAMTVGWGALGTMWGKPYAQVVVRPCRYTFEFMNQFDTFTLCGFPESYRAALQYLGSRSGRAGDKLAEAGLKPGPSTVVAAPSYAGANLIFECRKMYWQDIDPAHFVDPALERNYPQKDYHRVYFGEIVALLAASPVPACTG